MWPFLSAGWWPSLGAGGPGWSGFWFGCRGRVWGGWASLRCWLSAPGGLFLGGAPRLGLSVAGCRVCSGVGVPACGRRGSRRDWLGALSGCRGMGARRRGPGSGFCRVCMFLGPKFCLVCRGERICLGSRMPAVGSPRSLVRFGCGAFGLREGGRDLPVAGGFFPGGYGDTVGGLGRGRPWGLVLGGPTRRTQIGMAGGGLGSGLFCAWAAWCSRLPSAVGWPLA